MEALKEAFSPENTRRIGRVAARVWSGFCMERYEEGLDEVLGPLALKQRVGVVADRLEKELPTPPERLFEVLVAMLDGEDGSGAEADASGLRGFAVWPLTALVARHGHGVLTSAFAALREMTIRFTAEFAVQSFLQAHPQQTLAQMMRWAEDPNPHVRRLASEGCRPRLPWGVRMPTMEVPPYPTLAVLERLYRDESDYVRLSVANHLNDLSKAAPGLVLDIVRRWLAEAPGERRLERLARHACRSLIKQGHLGALALLGVGDPSTIEVVGFDVSPGEVRLGDSVGFCVRLRNLSEQPQRVVLDYRVDFLRCRGDWSGKVFKWKVFELGGREVVEVSGRHHFLPVTTRRHYAGVQQVRPQVNGLLGPACPVLLSQ